MRSLDWSKKDVLVMWSACAEDRAATSISSVITHRLGSSGRGLVHKTLGYTPSSAQTSTTKPHTFTLVFGRINRLLYEVIPALHRAYIYDKKFNLMNI